MIDSHVHINSIAIENIDKEIYRINKSKITGIINVGLDLKTSKEAIDIGNSNSKFYTSIGIHPLYEGTIESIYNLYKNSNSDKIVAIGETGIDSTGNLAVQIQKFIESIELANELKLPIIIHSRNTNNIVIDILKTHRPKYGFVSHCLQPDLNILEDIINLGGYASFGTPITKANAKKSLEVIEKIPIDRVLIELDYPFMSKNPNVDGINTFNVLRKHTNKSFIELESIIDENTLTLFKKMNHKHI